MSDFIAHNAKFVVDWGQPVLALIILAGIGGLLLIGRKNRFFLPKGILAWIGGLATLGVMGMAGLLFVVVSMENPQTGMILEQFEGMKGKKAPPLAFTLVADDSIHTIEEYRGNILLVNVWATWCPPCLKEMPDLDKVQESYPNDVRVIALSDESREIVARFVKQNQMNIHIGYVPMFDWAGTDLGSVRPVTFLVDREGVIRDYYTGAYDHDFYASRIEPLLN